MATKKRARHASGAAASQSKRREGASTRRAGAQARSKKSTTLKKSATPKSATPKSAISKKRASPGASRPAAKAAPKRAVAKRRTTGAGTLGVKSVGGKKATKRAKERGAHAITSPARRRASRKPPHVASAERVRASTPRRSKSDVRRRDGAGHIDPQYASDLLAQRGTSDRDEGGAGFVRQPRSGDDLAENLAEEFVASATSGENQEEEVLDQEVPEERGGPFVESNAGTEFAWGTDASNPKNAKREPFPTT